MSNSMKRKRETINPKILLENSELVDNGFKAHVQESTCGESDDT